MKVLVKNQKVFFNYDIQEKFNAGIELFGLEVKSIRLGHANLESSYVVVRGGEAYLIGVDVTPYQQKNTPKEYESKRNRRLLLNKKEIQELSKYESVKGLTIVPIALYDNGRSIKVEIGIAKGKKKFDKRQSITKREGDREIERTLKNSR